MNINKYNDYISDIILENIKNDELVLFMSDELKMLIGSINHPISKRIMENSENISTKFKITLLDIDNSNENKLDNISFSISNKTIEKANSLYNLNLDLKQPISYYDNNNLYYSIKNHKKELFGFNRSSTSLGKIINKLYPGEYKPSGDPGNDIESFVAEYKSLRNQGNLFNFDLVNGEDIVYWYNQSNYSDLIQGPLHSSCMRYNKCSTYIEFYAANPDKVSLLILKDLKDETKIRGRAVVWNLDLPSGRTFMDRIYTIHDHDIIAFKDYAKEHGWIYKKDQNMDEDGIFVDTMYDDNYDTRVLRVDDMKDSEHEEYPYMDTLKYYDGDILSNNKNQIDEDSIKILTSVSGEFSGGGYWSDYYNDYIDIEDGDYNYCDDISDYRHNDDCFYSEFYGEVIDNDYSKDYGEFCDYGGDDTWRRNGDYIELDNGKTATQDYADENFYYSDYSDEWCEEASYSNYHGTYINDDNVVEVYTDAQKRDTDYRSDDDGTWWQWDYDDEKYDQNVTLDELKEENGLNKKREINKHLRKKREKNNTETND